MPCLTVIDHEKRIKCYESFAKNHWKVFSDSAFDVGLRYKGLKGVNWDSRLRFENPYFNYQFQKSDYDYKKFEIGIEESACGNCDYWGS